MRSATERTTAQKWSVYDMSYFWPRQIADTCADTAYLLLRDKRPCDECARADRRHGERRNALTYNEHGEAIAGPPAAGRAFENMRAGRFYRLTTAAYLPSFQYPRACGQPKSQGFRRRDPRMNGPKCRWMRSPRINLDLRLHCIRSELD